MKILHYQHNGVGVVLSNEMNTRLNTTSKVLATYRHPFGFKANYVTPPIPHIARILLAYLFNSYFDILHSHDGFRLPNFVLNKWQGRFIQHYHDPIPNDLYPGFNVPAFVSTMNALHRIPNSVWMPLPVDTTKFKPHTRIYNPNVITIGFSYNPSADKNKLNYIPRQELLDFANTHKQIKLNPLDRHIHYTYMPLYYGSLDIYVDRIGLDSYGWQAIEAAARGCVVVTQSTHHPSDCPFSFATRESLSNVLESIITLPVKMILNMKQQSVDYAMKYHNLTTLVDKYLTYYTKLGDINEFTTSV